MDQSIAFFYSLLHVSNAITPHSGIDVKAFAIVSDFERNHTLGLGNVYFYPFGFTVFLNIIDGFLDDAFHTADLGVR